MGTSEDLMPREALTNALTLLQELEGQIKQALDQLEPVRVEVVTKPPQAPPAGRPELPPSELPTVEVPAPDPSDADQDQ